MFEEKRSRKEIVSVQVHFYRFSISVAYFEWVATKTPRQLYEIDEGTLVPAAICPSMRFAGQFREENSIIKVPGPASY